MKVRVYDIATLNKSNFDFNNNYLSILYLDTSSITRNTISEFKEYASNSDEIPSRAKRAVEKDTIIISTVRPNLEHYGFLETPANNTVVSTGFVTVHADRTKVDPKYLYYLLTSPKAVAYLTAIANTAVSSYPSFNPDDLGNYELDILDSIEEQKKIVQVLSSLDAQITNNRSIVSELESLARLIYDYWFVQFDFPDEHGRPYKSSGGKMVWNDKLKRHIPATWEVGTLGDCIEKISTGLNPRDNFVLGKGNIKYLTVKNLTTSGTIDFTNYDIIDEDARTMVHKRSDISIGDILFASIAPLGRCFLIQSEPTNWDINESVFSIRSNKEKITPEFLYLFFKSDSFIRKSTNSSTGSIFKGIRINTLLDTEMIIPDLQICKRFTSIVKPFFQDINNYSSENDTLTSLRDFLLPMLMNGQVTVK